MTEIVMLMLPEYLEGIREREGTDALARFAKRANTTLPSLLQVARGTRGAGPKMMKGIVHASRGAITYESLIALNPNIDRPKNPGGRRPAKHLA